jgi:hypothetical protein
MVVSILANATFEFSLICVQSVFLNIDHHQWNFVHHHSWKQYSANLQRVESIPHIPYMHIESVIDKS